MSEKYSQPTKIEVYQPPSKGEVVLTRRGKAALAIGGTLLAGSALVHGIIEHPGNPVGGVIQDVIETGIKVVDVIPGVDTPEQTKSQ